MSRSAPSRTLFFVDWDDTLLPSTWLLDRGINEMSMDTTPEEKNMLNDIDVSATLFLGVLAKLGKVVILTSASREWIESSLAAFMPRTALVATSLEVTSARELYESYFPEDPTAWKTSAMHESIQKLSQFNEPLRNIISIGDSLQERIALFYAASTLKDSFAKSVKFVDKPGIRVIQNQLDHLARVVHTIVEHEGHVDIEFVETM
jgi:hypothetical protein